MNEQLKRRLKALEKKYPNLDDFTNLFITFKDGSVKEMLWSNILELSADDIEKIEGKNPDIVLLAYCLLGIDLGLSAYDDDEFTIEGGDDVMLF